MQVITPKNGIMYFFIHPSLFNIINNRIVDNPRILGEQSGKIKEINLFSTKSC